MTVSRPLFLVAVLLAGLALTPARGENWPGWRGPTQNGLSSEKNLPAKWGDKENVLWSVALPGPGASTPAVWDDRMFLTCQDGAGQLSLVCVGTDGKQKWQKAMGGGGRWIRGKEGNLASASPSTDGKRVYAFVGNGTLAAHDFDGKEVWKFNVQDRFGKFKIAFGLQSTPVLYKDRLYLQLIHEGTAKTGASVVALDTKDGSTVWTVHRPSDGRAECLHSYASPTLWQSGDSAYLITHGNDYAVAHSLVDGKEIWRVGGLNPKGRYNPTLRFVSSPVATPNLIVIPSAKNLGVVGLDPTAMGLVMPGNRFERWRLSKGTPDVPSPLVVGNLVYLSGERGRLTCLDARTGNTHYAVTAYADIYRGSPVYADGKIILTAKDGTFTVVKEGTTYERLASNKLPDTFTASPAIAGGRIYLRGWNRLYAIGAR